MADALEQMRGTVVQLLGALTCALQGDDLAPWEGADGVGLVLGAVLDDNKRRAELWRRTLA
jgi:hypothetical protein